MLTMTDNASTAVTDLTRSAGLPAEGGLRIAGSQAQPGTFELALVPEPLTGDEVVEQQGARVFVEPETAALLTDQQLDAAPTEGGTAFSLGTQR